jgi:hypothetical protein
MAGGAFCKPAARSNEFVTFWTQLPPRAINIKHHGEANSRGPFQEQSLYQF